MHTTRGCSGIGTRTTFRLTITFAIVVRAVAASHPPCASSGNQDWFSSRNAIHDKSAPNLLQGAVASAFNQTNHAEQHLRQVIAWATDPHDYECAREELFKLYARLGMFHEALIQANELLKRNSNSEYWHIQQTMYATFSRYQNQSVRHRAACEVGCTLTPLFGLLVDVQVNEHPVHWMLDTGADLSVTTESEARMIGLIATATEVPWGDGLGHSTSVRLGIAERIMIGKIDVRNVPFVIVKDSQLPFRFMAAGKRGIIGLPLAAALQTLRWDVVRGTLQVGFRPRRQNLEHANLCFDGMHLLTRVEFQNKFLTCDIDTGNQKGTELWPPFASQFSELIRSSGATTRTQTVTTITGQFNRALTVLPEVRLHVGGASVDLRSVRVLLASETNGTLYGSIGLDVFRKVSTVTVDFRAMELSLQ